MLPELPSSPSDTRHIWCKHPCHPVGFHSHSHWFLVILNDHGNPWNDATIQLDRWGQRALGRWRMKLLLASVARAAEEKNCNNWRMKLNIGYHSNSLDDISRHLYDWSINLVISVHSWSKPNQKIIEPLMFFCRKPGQRNCRPWCEIATFCCWMSPPITWTHGESHPRKVK